MYIVGTVDGQNPAPPRMMIIPLFIGFQPSQVVQDFFHQLDFLGGHRGRSVRFASAPAAAI